MKAVVSSPLRYPGGKTKLFPFFADIISANDLFCCEYREPFAGGAGLALNLLAAGFVKHIHLNDIDPGIFAFWVAATRHTEELCSLVKDSMLNIDEWHRQRAIWQRPSEHSQLKVGFATLYLNRANRSGIIEGAGPVGGYHQSGSLRLDARFNRATIVDRLRMVGELAGSISVTNLDALEYVSNHVQPENLTYLDPPYYVRGQRLYKNFYSHEDHLQICAAVRKLAGRWVISYDDVAPIRDMYDWVSPVELTLRYTAGNSAVGREVVYVSPSLKVRQTELRVA